MSETAKVMQARLLISQGRLDQARGLLKMALARAPGDADLNDTMARALALSGQFSQAVYFAERAATASAGGPEAAARLTLLGGVQLACGDPAAAEPTLARSLVLDGSQVEATVARTEALLALDRAREAEAQGRAGLVLAPDHPTLLRAVAYALLTSARPDESVALLRTATARHPADGMLAAALAAAMNYCPGSEPAEVLGAHRRAASLARVVSAPLLNPPPPLPARGGPLRIALVSPDLRAHPVAFFVEPLLEHLDRGQFKVACYSTSPREDATTQRLKAKADLWRSSAALPDRDLAMQIRADGADIAIDLAGGTGGGRPGVFIHRGAPVQATYLGYPATTGLDEIGWRLVDSATDPEPEPGAAPYTSERLLRLDPCFICYRPPPDADTPPARSEGAVAGGGGGCRFGSFNAIQKLNDRVIDVWSRILSLCPGSTLTLKVSQFADPALRADIEARFAARGISADRLRLLGRTADLRSHLDAYAAIDVALDPFPYNGTTTTCDCLLMGVPVVTLAGRPGNHAGRVGVSLLSCVGAAELIAPDEDRYIRIATDLAGGLAGGPARRSEYRAGLRARLLASPLCDGPGFAARFGAAVRTMCRQAG